MTLPIPPVEELDDGLRRYAARDAEGNLTDEGNELLRFWNGTPDAARRLLEIEFELWHRGDLGPRLTELVRLAVANHTGCPICLTVRYPRAADAGVDEEMIAAIPRLDDARFTERERMAIDYATRMSGDHHTVTEDHYAALADHFTHRELSELTILVALFTGMGRFLETLTRGTACPIHDDHPAAATAG